MTEKIFRPFWSYDIEKTENWLSAMAVKGYHVVKLNTITRQFFFVEGPPEEVRYRLMYDKTQGESLPQTLRNDGWHQVFQIRNWQLTRNNQSPEDIQNFPVSDGILKRNRILMYVFGGIFIYMTFTALLFLSINAWVLFSGTTGSIEGSPWWILTITVGIVMWTWIPYSAIKLYKSNKRLAGGANEAQFSHSKEKQLKKAGKRIAKWRMGWIYSPDKLENWLEKMEEQGYHLVRIGKFGNRFYFEQGTPRNVRYCADYQNTLNRAYFDMHKEAGWHLLYSRSSFLSKWSIWSKVYENDEEVPQLYSDQEHMLKHARRVATTHSLVFGPIVIMYLILISMNLDLAQEYGMDTPSWLLFIILGITTVEFGVIVVKSVLYYRRIKKKTV